VRILRGAWAGANLVSPSGRVRPTAEEVRDAWLTSLAADLPGARVLELYAGSGALGLEALSRGAATCDFVENNPSALHALKANVAATRARGRTRIFKHDALRFIDGIREPGYDVVLADPPYGSGQLDRLLASWLEKPFSAILTVEHPADHPLPGCGRALRIGQTTVTTYRLDRSTKGS
jgi:16S rRNA (guanine966-N2)-methyltransferase